MNNEDNYISNNISWNESSATNDLNVVTGYDTVVTVILAGALMVTIFLGNGLTISAYLKDRSLRTVPFNVFIIYLAAADLLVGVVTIPFHVMFLPYVLSSDLPIVVKIILSYFSDVPVLVSFCCVLLMSIDRLRMVKDPFKYKLNSSNKRNLKQALAVLLTVVVYLNLVLSMAFINGLILNLAPSEQIILFYTILPFSNFYSPCTAIVITNMLFVIHLRRQLSKLSVGKPVNSMQLERISRAQDKDVATWNLTVNNVRDCCDKDSVALNRTDRGQLSKKLRKVAFNLSVLVAAYMLCWCPFNVLLTLATLFSINVPQTVVVGAIFLLFFNSAINPVIYAFINPSFRYAMIKVITAGRRKINRS